MALMIKPTTLTLLNRACRLVSSRQVTTVTSEPSNTVQRRHSYQQASLAPDNLPATSVTTWISELAANATIDSLSDTVIYRSQRMMLDTFGVGILGAKTDISHTVQQCAHTWGTMHGHVGTTSGSSGGCTLWGSKGRTAPLAMAAFINGVNVHSMDFDDTWFPATHPSGPVLPAIVALAETMTGDYEPSTEDLLVAYNVGIQVQGLLLRCSQTAKTIPDRFHPPAVVGVMGSAAASARLLGFSPLKTRHALAIAASFAGAPMANAGTTTKPLHTGKAARFGLEAALLADHGLEGNHDILDMDSGFGAFYNDYDPDRFLSEHADDADYVLHDQDIAIKRFPAHLGMHWAIDATLEARGKICSPGSRLKTEDVKSVHVLAPNSRYINRPLPTSMHEARHSFQFNVCTALLDGEVTPASFTYSHRRRPFLNKLLACTTIEAPADNRATFHDMYVEIHVTMKDGSAVSARCETPYGHWRNPLSDSDLKAKFLSNTKDMLYEPQKFLIESVTSMADKKPASNFLKTLRY